MHGNAGLREAASRLRLQHSLGRTTDGNGVRALLIKTLPAPPHPEGPATRSIVEVDVLVVDDRPLLVPHDVVAVQTVAVLIEIVFAFRTGHFPGGKDRLADFAGIGRAALVDRRSQDGHGIRGRGGERVGVACGTEWWNERLPTSSCRAC